MDLSDVISGAESRVSRSARLGLESFSLNGIEYPVTERGDVSCTATSIGDGRVLLECATRVTLTVPCSRCLEDVQVPLSLRAERELSFLEGAPGKDGLPGGGETRGASGRDEAHGASSAPGRSGARGRNGAYAVSGREDLRGKESSHAAPGRADMRGKDGAPGGRAEDSGDDAEEMERQKYVDGEAVDLDALLYDEISLKFPSKTLCKPDCKGLCPMCGKNLNLGSCGCEEQARDPRMAAIQSIFKNRKEV